MDVFLWRAGDVNPLIDRVDTEEIRGLTSPARRTQPQSNPREVYLRRSLSRTLIFQYGITTDRDPNRRGIDEGSKNFSHIDQFLAGYDPDAHICGIVGYSCHSSVCVSTGSCRQRLDAVGNELRAMVQSAVCHAVCPWFRSRRTCHAALDMGVWSRCPKVAASHRTSG